MNCEDLPDPELVLQAAAGSAEAFQALYARYRLRVYRFAREMSGSTEMADEITQDVFFFLVRQLSQFDSKRGALGSYLMGIARNQTLRVLKRERLYVEMDEFREAVADPAPSLAENLERMQSVEHLRQAIRSLPAQYREVVLLCELEELDYAEAAKVMNCPIGTVRSRLHRARAMLMERCLAEGVRTNR